MLYDEILNEIVELELDSAYMSKCDYPSKMNHSCRLTLILLYVAVNRLIYICFNNFFYFCKNSD